MEIQDHVLFFHFREDGVEAFVVEDPGRGILGSKVNMLNALKAWSGGLEDLQW